jgi:Asp-tRNA(Asn)/Glu-tRNA(Gln) amidotransferase A subunit family amidase
MAFEMARAFAWEMEAHRESLVPEAIEYLEIGAACPRPRYEAALRLAERCRWVFDQAMARYDVLLVPSTLGEAPPIATTGRSVFIRIWTLLHAPVVSLRAGTSPASLPISVQLVGARWSDAALLSRARVVEDLLSVSR